MNRAKNIKHIFYFFLGISIFISGEVIGSERDLKKLQITGNCPDCSLIKSDLSGANLSGADLSNANLSGADLSKAELEEVASMKGINLDGARLCETKLPWGIDNSGC